MFIGRATSEIVTAKFKIYWLSLKIYDKAKNTATVHVKKLPHSDKYQSMLIPGY
jgi:hypothetical protein